MSMYHLCAWCLCEAKEDRHICFPGTGIIDSYELPGRYWEYNLDPQKEQPVLLITEPSLQSLLINILVLFITCTKGKFVKINKKPIYINSGFKYSCT